MLKTLAYIFGAVLLVIGLLGFVPAATPNGFLLGYFHVNALHNVVHIVTGLAAFGAACCPSKWWNPRTFFQVFGVIYLVVSLLGFYMGDSPILGVLANNFADSVLHLVIAIVSLYLGFLWRKEIV